MLFGAGGGWCAKASSILWIRASGRIPFHRTDFGCTHQSEWRGITPTGKAVQVTAVNIDRVVGGRIVENGGAANLLEPLLGIEIPDCDRSPRSVSGVR